MSSLRAAALAAPRDRWRLARVPFESPGGAAGVLLLAAFCVLAVAGPLLTPHDPTETHFVGPNQVAQLEPPSRKFWLGTTYYGRDVLSQVMVGARVAIIVGLLSAFFITFIGTNVGLIAGYYGRRVDDVLMRVTDIAFGVPFLPFAVVLVALLRPSLWNIIFTISCLLWRTTARVIRSQVLSLKERPFIRAARVAGASDLRIMYVHLLPNVLPMALLYVAFGVAWAVLSEASLSFLGFGDPRTVSWGQMLYAAYISGSIRHAWWAVVPPGACITLFVASVFLIGREYERVVNPRLARG
jgi:peptide/nickel transport system permease protein